jgi:predicted  nucleic acid-binding Zn-ribbon protein
MGWFFNRDSESSEKEPGKKPNKKSPDGPQADEISNDRIKKEILKREQALDEVEKNIQQRRDSYQKYLEKGAGTQSRARRQVYALKARMEKYLGNLNKLKQLKIMRDISKLTLLTGQAEIRNMIDDISTEHEVVEAAATDPETFQEEVTEVEAELKADIDEVSEQMSAMDIETADLGFDQTEEHELMEDIATGERDVDEVVDEQTDQLIDAIDSNDLSDDDSDDDGNLDTAAF